MSLEQYNLKRNFEETTEPAGEIDAKNGFRFVVQRHKASRLHYDLRLEMDGVLKSWAVPKGPSMNPSDKRLAIHTEDHPVKYLSFEGKIPKGNYGAGVMKIWDEGNFGMISIDSVAPEKKMQQQYVKGDLKLIFHGQKLKGSFALVRTKTGEKQNKWLLIKKKDEFATSLEYDAEELFVLNAEESVATRNFKDLDPGKYIQPMLATHAKEVFDHADWLYELKWDGYRVMAHLHEGHAKLFSRNGVSYTEKFSPVARELDIIPHDAVLDGEMVIVNEEGLPDFQKLQNYDPEKTVGALRYYVFDLLHLNGIDTVSLTLKERKSLLPELLEGLDRVIFCDHLEGMGSVFYNRAIEAGMEGIMAKKADSRYFPGVRSTNWLKIKSIESAEVLICGFTDSVNGGHLFGSLILGSKQQGKLVYIGNCGSGYDQKEQEKLQKQLEKLLIADSPFDNKLNLKGRKPNWVKPELICAVKYSEMTKSGLMRHPVYKGLRKDKDILEITNPESVEVSPKVDSGGKPFIHSTGTEGAMEINGFQVNLTNLDKIYWPDEGIRKYDLIDYYLKISDTILPYLVDRPQNMHRHPNGIKGKSFYQKDQETLPDWIETYAVYTKSTDKTIDYMLCQHEAALLYMANLGCIEINPWSSRVQNPDSPDFTVIDIDPSDKNTFEEVIEVAHATKEVLDLAGITGYCKTSGSSGMHVYIPLEAQYSYDEARDFTKLLCYYIHDKTDPLTSMDRAVKNRKEKIYLDYLQNRKGQTLASAYCARPKAGATVSTPLKWEEVKTGLDKSDFNIFTMPERIAALGDLFSPVLGKGIDMQKALTNLQNA